ncbi:MAG: glycosyltransferase [Lachnospiraceae bacterium]|nr:glycosyltransferase [Lachnospiraceae bacterium]
MSELLYIKYNSHRKPEYQISTRIVSDEGVKKVIKSPLTDKAKLHIEKLMNNHKILSDYYNNISVIDYKKTQNNPVSKDSSYGLEFEYIKGESILSKVHFEKDDIESIISKLDKLMDMILDVREDYICEFSETEEFNNTFPDCHPTKGIKAFTICNLDSIFENFICTSDGLKCIDYEWVLEYPVPVDYLRFRMLHYLFNEKTEYLRDRISEEEFLKGFRLSDDDITTYSKMEMHFQYMVHGEDVRFIYLERYKKRMLTSEKAFQLIDSKDEHIGNLENLVKLKDDALISKDEMIRSDQELIKGKDEILSKLQQDNSDLLEANGILHKDLTEHSQILGEKIEEIQVLSARYQKLKRCVKNPFYGLYSLVMYYPNRNKAERERRRLEAEQLEQQEKEQLRIRDKAEADRIRFEELLKITEGDYESWIAKREAEYDNGEVFEYYPLISIVVPVYNVEDRHLKACIESVEAQTYKNYQLILVDDCSTYENVKPTLKKMSRWKRRIKTIFRKTNGGISECTNTGINKAKGEYIAFMDCDDTIAPFALYEVVKKLNEDRYDFIYSDEDKIDDDGTRRHDPFFKPDWSPDTLMSYMYTSHLGVYKRELIQELEGLRSEFDGCQDYDLTLRVAEKTDKIGHISKVLYHWREREESTAGNPEAKSYVKDRTKLCKDEAILRRKLNAETEWLEDIYQFRVRYIPKDSPLVSVIIPSKDNPKILEQCLSTLTQKTDYNKYEIIVVDNGSSDANKTKYQELCSKYLCTYHYEKMDFNFSYMCNKGASLSKGDYLLFLNDDIEIINSEWLDRMLGQVELPHVGAVGAKLLYPNTTLIQHTGVISIEGGPVHEFAKMDDDESYYFNRNRLDFDVLAVTAACLMIKKDKFDEVDGFDEELAVAYNDIDLCFKLVEAGYVNVMRNDAILYHHESISRGDDAMDPEKFARLMAEQDKLYNKHPQYKKRDPFYNENLTQTDCDFEVNYEMDIDYSIKETDVYRYEIDETIRYGIDIARNDWCTYIEGWAFKEGFDDNINLDTKFILEGKQKSYVLNTFPVRREDVVETFSNENCISFCGCKARINRGIIEKGEYVVRVICNGKIADKSRVNINSKESIRI